MKEIELKYFFPYRIHLGVEGIEETSVSGKN